VVLKVTQTSSFWVTPITQHTTHNTQHTVVTISHHAACSICNGASAVLCAGCSCLYLCAGCQRQGRGHDAASCRRLEAGRLAALGGGFYEFPFAWYPPGRASAAKFGSVAELLEHAGCREPVVARLLLRRDDRDVFPFPFFWVDDDDDDDNEDDDDDDDAEGGAKDEGEDRGEDAVMEHMGGFWGATGNAFVLAGIGRGKKERKVSPSDWRSYVEARPGAVHFPLILDSAMTVYAAIERRFRSSGRPTALRRGLVGAGGGRRGVWGGG